MKQALQRHFQNRVPGFAVVARDAHIGQPVDMRAVARAMISTWGKVIKAAGMKLE